MSAFDNWVAAARAVPIGDVLAGRGIRLNTGSKKEPHGPCPRCGGDDRFYIRIKQERFFCRQCTPSGGDVINLVQWFDGCDFLAACETLTGKRPPPRKGNGLAGAAAHKIVVAEFQYEDESGNLLFAVERLEYLRADGGYVLKDGKRKKTFRQKRPDPELTGKWLLNVDSLRVVPYRLPELVEAIAQGQTIYIVEGERKVDALAAWNVPATCNAMGAGHWTSEHSAFLKDADIVLVPDADRAGFGHVNAVGATLNGIAARVRVLVLPDLPVKGDVIDWIKAGGTREQLDALVAKAPLWTPPPEAELSEEQKRAKAQADEQALIDELSRLSGFDYDRRREEAADDLGVRRSSLDREVEARRARQREEAGPAPLFGHWVVEPWPEPVDTDALLLQIQRRLQRHIVFSSHNQAIIVALWVLFTWVHELATHSPKLLITSAVGDCGKSTLASLIGFLVPRPLSCVNISEATLFRSVEYWSPTLILTDADTLFVNNEPVRAVVNASWARGWGVPRCVGDDHVPHWFPIFCPQVLDMIGKRMPATTLGRCIVIELKRKMESEHVEHFNLLDDAHLGELRQQALCWALDNGEHLKVATPETPEGFQNRLGDNYRLLFAIADHARREWPERARLAAQQLSCVIDVSSRNVRLLAAIKEAFGTLEAIGSADLVGRLTADETAEWTDWKGGKPISQAQLASALSNFGISP